MNLFNKTFNSREFKSILGKKNRNFWILFLVFFFSIGALEVSRSGLKYLSYQMSDPFINWVEVKLVGDNQSFEYAVAKAKGDYAISTIENNNYILEYLFATDHKKIRVEGRTIAHDSQLLDKILGAENAVEVRALPIQENDYGWIVTQDLMERLGYDDPEAYPLFVEFANIGDAEGVAELGLLNDGDYITVPIPILAVVKQLPDLFDFITPLYFEEQHLMDELPFNISLHPSYFDGLKFVAENNVDLEKIVREELDKAGVSYEDNFVTSNYDNALRPAKSCKVFLSDTAISRSVNELASSICKNHPGIYRMYDYEFGEGYSLKTDYMSFMFDDLSKVPEFAKWAKDFGIRIDMAQIEAKNHFNIFNVLTIVMCLAIVVLSILFVAIFIWFLIDSHFRSISKNLGTYMAFGLSNNSIIKIYLRVFMKMILLSLFSAVMALLVLEYASVLLGWTRANGYRFFSFWDPWVWATIVLISILSVGVICISITKKLKVTPGDLIFERNINE